MARGVDKLYDSTSASGGALDTGKISTALYEELFGYYTMNGGAPTACQAYIEDPAAPGAFLAVNAAATPTVAGTLFCWGPLAAGGTGTVTAPVPTAVRFTIGAIAAQTVRFVLMGVRTTDGAN